MKVGKQNKAGVVIAGRKHNLRGFDDENPMQRYPQACNANIMQQFLLKGENVLWKKNLQR